MWPLSFFLIVAMAAQSQPNAAPPDHQNSFILQPKYFGHANRQTFPEVKLPADRSNLCFTMRSYRFHRQDGQAPVLTGMTTCTPASVLRQKQVSPAPAQYVPLGLNRDHQ